jgi:UDP-N-acetylglucosamine:LPS N-acetylglucosamine transferase
VEAKKLLADASKAAAMAAKLRVLARPDAAALVVDEVEKLVKAR